MNRFIAHAACLAAIITSSAAASPEWLSQAGLEVHGFLDARAGTRIQDDPYERRTSLAEARLQLQLDKSSDSTSFRTRMDLLHDDIPGLTSLDVEKGTGALDLREAYILLTVFEDADIKIGRQIMTWGTGDLLFINDLFPKDWQAFFSGRDTDYLKAPSDAILISLFPSLLSIDIIYTPSFDPDRYISGDRISYWNPMLGRRAGNDAVASPETPGEWFRDDEIAARFYGAAAGTELAAYAYSGFWKSPSGFNPESGRATFPGLSVCGASIRRAAGEALISLEAGYYYSSDDPDGSNPLIPNSETRFLAAYEREIAMDLSLTIQYYLEHMQDYGPYTTALKPGQDARDRDRHVTTIRLMKRALNQNLTLSLFAYYSPSDEDFYIRPSAAYMISDNWSASAGANIFNGSSPYTFFAQFEKNSNVYGSMRYSF